MTDRDEKYQRIVSGWQRQRIQTAGDLDAVLSNFRILFAYHSNVIENPQITYHDTREIFENGQVIGYTGALRTLFEIQNQRDCYDFLKPFLLEKQPITPELILKIHKKLMKGCYDDARYAQGERPGQFKIHDYIVGDNIGAPACRVREEIESLCREINEFQGNDILTAAAWLHLSFESIHPFADGNGRVGRTLMNYCLMIHDHPPLIIYDEDKRTYYMGLAVFDKTGRLDGFRTFLQEELIRTWTPAPVEKRPLSDYTE